MDETPPLPPVEPAGAQQRGGRLLKKLIVVGVIAVLAGLLYWRFGDLLSLEGLAERESQLLASARRSPAVVLAVIFLVYVAVTAFSLPAAALFTMGIGWLCRELFGELAGLLTAVVLVSFASTSGATLAFLMSRYLFRDAIQQRFGDRLAKFNQALRREGAFYLFTLRLIPAVPFFVINVVMGLTPIRVWTYWWVSQLGMLAGTFVYVYAGAQLPSLSEIADKGTAGVVNAQLVIAFVLLGLFPLIVKKIMSYLRGAKSESTG